MSTIAIVPNAIVMATSGCVRRTSSKGASATNTATETPRQTRSLRTSPSTTTETSNAATSTQSRHTRVGGVGDRGSAHNPRAASRITTSSIKGAGRRRIGRKNEPHIVHSVGHEWPEARCRRRSV